MNDEEILFDMDEEMGSYYDFNLLDLLDNNESTDFGFDDSDSNSVKMY